MEALALAGRPTAQKLTYVVPGDRRATACGHQMPTATARGSCRSRGHPYALARLVERRVVYFIRSITTQNLEPSQIGRVRAAGGTPKPVTTTTRRAVYPAPARDGSGLLYSANPTSSELALWWMPVSGTPVRITTGVGDYAEARLSTDIRTLVASVNQDRRSLWVVSIADGNVPDVKVLTQGSSGDLDPAVAPRGDRLAFSSTRTGNRHIWTSRLDGTDARELTSGDALEERPAWSPDSSTIAFVSSRGTSRAIWLVNTDGSGLRKVLDAQVIDALTWSPDGRELAYAAPSGAAPALFRVRLNGGEPFRIPTPEGATSPSWSAPAIDRLRGQCAASALGSGARRLVSSRLTGIRFRRSGPMTPGFQRSGELVSWSIRDRTSTRKPGVRSLDAERRQRKAAAASRLRRASESEDWHGCRDRCG